MTRYLYALDLSMSRSGLVIMDIDAYEAKVITSFKTDSDQEHGLRLKRIADGIKKYVKDYPVTEVAIERGFTQFNNATQVTFRVHGVVNYLFCNFKQTYYTPKTVKLAVTGDGNASKEQVMQSIMMRYPDAKFMNEDESDAFAIAITHCIKKYGLKWRDKESKPRRGKG